MGCARYVGGGVVEVSPSLVDFVTPLTSPVARGSDFGEGLQRVALVLVVQKGRREAVCGSPCGFRVGAGILKMCLFGEAQQCAKH